MDDYHLIFNTRVSKIPQVAELQKKLKKATVHELKDNISETYNFFDGPFPKKGKRGTTEESMGRSITIETPFLKNSLGDRVIEISGTYPSYASTATVIRELGKQTREAATNELECSVYGEVTIDTDDVVPMEEQQKESRVTLHEIKQYKFPGRSVQIDKVLKKPQHLK
ncbi:hypothetical protein SNEBB_010144 [Seison nebaliae]|nr:hypothetical protein SNEBB_010144 [Seison nebaliae]